MTYQYLAVLARSPAGRNRIRQIEQAHPDWDIWRHGSDIIILLPPGRERSHCGSGFVLGSLFTRSGHKMGDISVSEQASITASRGRCLTERYWGSYVALFADAEHLDIIRSPFGELPCYWSQTSDVAAVGSDIALLAAAGVEPRVEWSALSRRLIQFDHVRSETCLAEIHEVRGGERLTLSTDKAAEREQIWSPWTFARREREFTTVDEAVARVRDAVRLSVTARTASHRRLLLLLSGGVDSSVVAASLAHAGRDFGCLTLFTDDASGDESRYAQLVAGSFGASFRKERRDLAHIDIRRSESPHLPRPTNRCFEQETFRLAHANADAIGASAIIDGGGGDNVFNNHLSVAPIADCWLRFGPTRAFWPTVLSIAQLSQTSALTVARRGIARAWRPARSGLTMDLRYLSPAAQAAAGGMGNHPWLDAPADALPGNASYISGLIPAQGLIESYDPGAPLPSLSVLISQPLIETCLRVPSWMWFEPDRNRAVARRAFADALPPAVVARTSKGNPGGFIAQIFETKRDEIFSFLRDGRMSAQGLLDWTKLDHAFASTRVVRDFEFLRIMQLVDAEAWSRGWP